jgi:hypothetical protein
MYCGELAEISQPLLLIGMKTPMSMELPLSLRPATGQQAACQAGAGAAPLVAQAARDGSGRP